MRSGPLGQGGMAEVFRAWDRERRAWCAVKVLFDRYAQKPSARRRFVEEGRTLLQLRHRNLIEAWDLDENAVRPFLVMEIAEGGSLMDWVNRNGPVAPRLAVDAALQISKGLGAAHAAGVVHRDVKPHNILLSQRGLCKVTDFGIAQIMMDGHADIPDATIQSQGVMGTLGYMAPEQRTDPHSADVRTDIYGIGATLYTLLTGNVETNLFVAERDPQKLQGLPESLVPVLMRATAYRIEQRYANVEALRRALFEASRGLPADPPGTPPNFAQTIPEMPPPVPPKPPAIVSLNPSAIAPARRIIRRSTPPEEPEPRTRPLVVAAALLGIVIGLAATDIFYVFAYERAAVQASAYGVARIAGQSVSVCDQFRDHNASVANQCDAGLEAIQRLRLKPMATHQASGELTTLLRQHTSLLGTDGRSWRTKGQIDAVERERDRLGISIEEWRAAAAFPCLAVCVLGLADAPY